MLRDIFAHSYSPTLCVRPAEMRALQELPEQDKDRIFPLILLAPWANSKTLEQAVERIQAAYGQRPFFLGLDRYYRPRDPSKSVALQFQSISDSFDGFENYFSFVEEYSQCIPVLDMGASNLDCLRRQISRAERLGRGFLFHIHDQNTPIGSDRFRVVGEIPHTDFAFYIDKGWNPDPLTEEIWYQGICQSIFSEKERAAVVVCSSSFPKDFTEFEGIEAIPVGPRRLSRRMSQRFNNSKILHGDWGSAKPRSYEIASTPLPRVDYALRDQWVIARNKTDDWDYRTAAEELIESDYWHDEVNVWGTYRIKETADGLPYSIGSAQAASAARINIHLHVQAHYDEPDFVINTDDPWEDI